MKIASDGTSTSKYRLTVGLSQHCVYLLSIIQGQLPYALVLSVCVTVFGSIQLHSNPTLSHTLGNLLQQSIMATHRIYK